MLKEGKNCSRRNMVLKSRRSHSRFYFSSMDTVLYGGGAECIYATLSVPNYEDILKLGCKERVSSSLVLTGYGVSLPTAMLI